MKRSSVPVGTEVSFTTTTGKTARGKVVQTLTEKRQPSILLIERPDGGRAFRFENEITVLALPATLPADAHAPMTSAPAPMLVDEPMYETVGADY